MEGWMMGDPPQKPQKTEPTTEPPAKRTAGKWLRDNASVLTLAVVAVGTVLGVVAFFLGRGDREEDQLHNRLANIDGRLSAIEGRLTAIEGRLTSVETTLTGPTGLAAKVHRLEGFHMVSVPPAGDQSGDD